MYATYKTIADVEEATTYFEDKMEAAGKPNMPNRIKYAKEALAKFGAVNGTVTPVIVNSDDPGLNFVSIIEDKTVLKGDINV